MLMAATENFPSPANAQAVAPGAETPAAAKPGQMDDSVFRLDKLTITDETPPDDDRYDSTGMDGPSAEMDEAPFSNDLVAGGSRPPEDFDIEINNELQIATGASPADLATGVNRVNLRGFPTPRLRNGFSQTGIPEILNIHYTELIQGPITPVTGRAAPGGIQNFITGRPTGRSRVILSAYGNSHRYRDVRLEETTPVVARRLWQRVSAGWRETQGPMDFAHLRTRYASGALTYRVNRSVSTMLSVDYLDLSGNPSPGVPEYRETPAGKIIGPYAPLTRFNAYGPNASVDKTLLSASFQVEAQLSRRVSFRACVLGFDRDLTEDRYTTGQYILSTGKFGGTREPRRIVQPFQGLVGSAETTARLSFLGTDHKVTLLVEQTHTSYTRIDYALTSADRARLPADMRSFNPFEPNYYRPEFSSELFRNLVTNRHESTDMTFIALSERAAFWRGKLVATIGARMDFVSLDLNDRRVNAPREFAKDNVSETTWHAGANYVVKPGRLLAFAAASKAFEPSTRVDARTGRIQGNETTLGYEAGLKGLFLKKRLSATLLAFQYFNQNISRRNPLYDDPIQDPDHTQPQLLEAGEERFTGGSLDLKADVAPGFIVSSRIACLEPITTKSLDFPEEVGRVLTRMPKLTIGATARYTVAKTFLQGLALSLTLTHVGDYVAYYENATREFLAYPGNTLMSFSLSRTWIFGDRKRPMRHTLGLTVRNLLDRDVETAFYRAGQNRELNLNYRFVW